MPPPTEARKMVAMGSSVYVLLSPPVSQTATLKHVTDTPMAAISTTGRSGKGIRGRKETATPTMATIAAMTVDVSVP
jgi:hypothetical protein